jgi:hypothetical protein
VHQLSAAIQCITNHRTRSIPSENRRGTVFENLVVANDRSSLTRPDTTVENRVGHKLFPGAQAKVRPSLILELLATATFSSEIRRGFDFWVVYLIYSMVYIVALRYN